MAGLLGDVLPWAYSQGDRLKRHVGGLLGDPLGTLAQTAGQMQDNHRKLQGLLDLAQTNPQARAEATDMMMAGPMGFAPAAMARAIYPRQHALETARKNAVKMLGLPESNTAMDRAKALGFDTPVYHGTTADFRAFDLAKQGTATDAGWYGKGAYTAPHPTAAEAYTMSDFPDFKPGANILPLLARRPEPITNKHGYVTEYVTRNPSELRSRFAAFDPARAYENDLLGYATLPMLGVLGTASLGTAYLANQPK